MPEEMETRTRWTRISQTESNTDHLCCGVKGQRSQASSKLYCSCQVVLDSVCDGLSSDGLKGFAAGLSWF